MKALFVVAQNNYQSQEYGIPKQILTAAGMEVVTASKNLGRCLGSHGGSTEATTTLEKANISEFDVILFVGGPGAVHYQHDPQAHLLARKALAQRKIVAAICIGPTILAHAGVLNGRKATVWNLDGQQEAMLKKNGATYTGDDVTVDGFVVTANGPQAAEKLGKTILDLLRNRESNPIMFQKY